MKASELIEALKKAVEEHGDEEVFGEFEESIEVVEYKEIGDSGWYEIY